jgi:hypothetical protein
MPDSGTPRRSMEVDCAGIREVERTWKSIRWRRRACRATTP